MAFRSNFERDIAQSLKKRGVKFTYETLALEYVWPARISTYTPDFILDNGVIIETKGKFTSLDRQKHKLVKQQHPDLDIRFLFMRANNKLSKASKTTYGDWADSNGYIWADGRIPEEWISEKPRTKGRRKSSS